MSIGTGVVHLRPSVSRFLNKRDPYSQIYSHKFELATERSRTLDTKKPGYSPAFLGFSNREERSRKIVGARSRTRTGTPKGREILSLLRLPISPSGRQRVAVFPGQARKGQDYIQPYSPRASCGSSQFLQRAVKEKAL